MRILINGGCGFLGSNIAAEGIRRGYKITILDNMSRVGAERNKEWLRSIGQYEYVYGDVRIQNDVERVVQNGNFDAVFHLAGQVAMTTSIENPSLDFQINTVGTINTLEAIRKFSPNTAMFYSSTNKVYGDLEQFEYSENETRYICDTYPNGFDEKIPLDFRSPYGCSKGAADQYMLDYHRIYGLKTVVFRHSSMYGGNQFATYDQGWVGWFCQKAYEIKKNPSNKLFTISGNGKQVRDLLNSEDMVRLYYLALSEVDSISGEVFNIGGGMNYSLSLLELFNKLEKIFDIKMKYEVLPPRSSDQKVFVADISKIKNRLNWHPIVTVDEGLERMRAWTEEIMN